MSLSQCIIIHMISCRHEALTAALSEKDAHLALLEVGGVRSSRAAQELEELKRDRSKLLDSIKHQVSTSQTDT